MTRNFHKYNKRTVVILHSTFALCAEEKETELQRHLFSVIDISAFNSRPVYRTCAHSVGKHHAISESFEQKQFQNQINNFINISLLLEFRFIYTDCNYFTVRNGASPLAHALIEVTGSYRRNVRPSCFGQPIDRQYLFELFLHCFLRSTLHNTRLN